MQEIIVKLDGRMGNQMFQWAFARAYEAKNGTMPIFDDSKETLKLTPFKLSQNIKTVEKPLWNKFLRKTVPFRNLRNQLTELKFDLPISKEDYYSKFSPALLEASAPVYIQGFFQTEKYFTHIREKLLHDFVLLKKADGRNKKMLYKIKNTNSFSIHFRRGDYTKNRVAKIFGKISKKYYYDAVEYIKQNTDEQITLFVFSDDINWVKKNIKFEYETIYVDINSGKKGYFDIELMKNCKHNIIANSSFSWWGAWLNENPDKIVVTPTPWMNDINDNYDIIPNNWISIYK